MASNCGPRPRAAARRSRSRRFRASRRAVPASDRKSRRKPSNAFRVSRVPWHRLRGLDRRFIGCVDGRFDCFLRRDIRSLDGSSLFLRHRLFTGLQIGLLLRETLFFVCLSLDRKTLLHLAFYFSPLLFFGLLLLAGSKKRERRDQRQNAKLFHCEVRPGWSFVIRRKLWRRRPPRPSD